MNKKVKKNTPQVRFAEFSESLEPKYLGEMLNFKNGINADKSQYGQGIKFINVLDIINKDPIYYDSIIGYVDITDQEFQKSDVQYGDVLFQRSSEIREEAGQSNIYLDKTRNATFGGFVIRGRPKKAKFNPIYFNYLLKTDAVRKEITDRSGGSTRFNIGQDSLSQIPILVCVSPAEQEKIANFLGAIDTRLTQLRRKHELLQTYKQAVIQKIFSQQIRFKRNRGNSFPDWEEKKLGLFLHEHQERVCADTDLPIYSSSRQGLRPQKEYFADRELDNEGEYKVVPNKYFVYRLMSDDLTFRFNINETGKSIAASREYPVFTTTAQLDSNFLFYKLNFSQDFSRFAIEQKRGGTRTRLYYKTLSSWKTSFPTIKEQEKIADFLISIDQKIEAVAKQIDLTEQFKKGLLQKMFV
jgi:type I restriction enzyme, S subunit